MIGATSFAKVGAPGDDVPDWATIVLVTGDIEAAARRRPPAIRPRARIMRLLKTPEFPAPATPGDPTHTTRLGPV
jgi:hypothetical protein